MKLRILGCSGGIGGKLRTTAMLLDHDVLIDAGTGVGDLEVDELSNIDHVFLTHSHLDHIAFLPFMLDSVGGRRERPVTIYAIEETLEALRQHIFNWVIWPDFSKIPNQYNPYLNYQVIQIGETVTLNGRAITVLPANHVVPAVGYQLDSGAASLVFTGDTTTHDGFWEVVNAIENLGYLIIETAYSNNEMDLAHVSKHLCPNLLAEDLLKLRGKPQIYITHLKPDEGELTMREINQCAQQYSPKMLTHGQVFEF